jgi:hypothetical protein
LHLKIDETLREREITESEIGAVKTSSELADELRFAPLANLKGRATSAPAAALVSHLANAYTAAVRKSPTLLFFLGSPG